MNQSMSVPVCMYVYVCERYTEKDGHTSQSMCVGITFLCFLLRETNGQMCIWIRACVCMWVRACACMTYRRIEPERKMGIWVRAGECGCTCVFAFLSERVQWTDVHTNQSTCVCILCVRVWDTDTQNQREIWSWVSELVCMDICVVLCFCMRTTDVHTIWRLCVRVRAWDTDA